MLLQKGTNLVPIIHFLSCILILPKTYVFSVNFSDKMKNWLNVFQCPRGNYLQRSCVDKGLSYVNDVYCKNKFSYKKFAKTFSFCVCAIYTSQQHE